MSKSKLASFGPETWAKGDRGLVGPWATDKPGLINTRMYADGSLGPRPKWGPDFKLLTQVDFTTNTKIFAAEGKTAGGGGSLVDGYMAICDDTDTAELYDWATHTKQQEFTGGTLGLGLFTKNTHVERVNQFSYVLFSGLPKLIGTENFGVPVPPAISFTDIDIAGAFGYFVYNCAGGVVHQGRAFFFGASATGSSDPDDQQRIHFSDPYSYNTFASADQYFDIDGAVAGVTSVGSNLFIWTEEGDWHVLQGRGNPLNGTRTHLGKARIPGRGRQPQRLDRSVMFLTSDMNSIATIKEGGSVDDTSLAQMGLDTVTYPYSSTAPVDLSANSLNNAVLVPGLVNEARHNWNGLWTKEEWGITTNSNFQLFNDEAGGYECIAFYPAGGSPRWTLRRRLVAIDQPPAAVFGDEPTTSRILLPRLVNPPHQLRPVKVVLDLRTFNFGNPVPTMSVVANTGDNQQIPFTIGPSVAPLGESLLFEEATFQAIATSLPSAFTHFCDIEIAFANLVIERVYVEYEIDREPVL